MKKILFSLFALVACVSASAITVDEAYDKLAALPGAALSEVPEYDCLKEGMDWGKVVMFMGCSQSTIASITEILAEITDESTDATVTSGKGVTATVFTRPVSEEKQRALVTSIQSNNGMNVAVVIYCEGGMDMVDDMNIN